MRRGGRGRREPRVAHELLVALRKHVSHVAVGGQAVAQRRKTALALGQRDLVGQHEKHVNIAAVGSAAAVAADDLGCELGRHGSGRGDDERRVIVHLGARDAQVGVFGVLETDRLLVVQEPGVLGGVPAQVGEAQQGRADRRDRLGLDGPDSVDLEPQVLARNVALAAQLVGRHEMAGREDLGDLVADLLADALHARDVVHRADRRSRPGRELSNHFLVSAGPESAARILLGVPAHHVQLLDDLLAVVGGRGRLGERSGLGGLLLRSHCVTVRLLNASVVCFRLLPRHSARLLEVLVKAMGGRCRCLSFFGRPPGFRQRD